MRFYKNRALVPETIKTGMNIMRWIKYLGASFRIAGVLAVALADKKLTKDEIESLFDAVEAAVITFLQNRGERHE